MSYISKGITGFFNAHQKFRPPTVSQKQIMEACNLVARETGYRVKDHYWARETQNFHRVRLTKHDNSVAVFFNEHYPVVAFGKGMPKDDWGALDVIEDDVLRTAFDQLTSFRPIPVKELARELSSRDLEVLGESEVEQAKYWSSKTVEEVIFNNWD